MSSSQKVCPLFVWKQAGHLAWIFSLVVFITFIVQTFLEPNLKENAKVKWISLRGDGSVKMGFEIRFVYSRVSKASISRHSKHVSFYISDIFVLTEVEIVFIER